MRVKLKLAYINNLYKPHLEYFHTAQVNIFRVFLTEYEFNDFFDVVLIQQTTDFVDENGQIIFHYAGHDIQISRDLRQ